MFSVCPHQGTYTPPHPLLGKVPTPLRPGQDGGGTGYPKVPTPRPRYLSLWSGQDGGTPRYLTPTAKVPTPSLVRSGWGRGTPRYLPPPAKVPTPPPRPRDRTAYGVLDTLRSVCLLRSGWRTFLFWTA